VPSSWHFGPCRCAVLQQLNGQDGVVGFGFSHTIGVWCHRFQVLVVEVDVIACDAHQSTRPSVLDRYNKRSVAGEQPDDLTLARSS